MSFNHRTGHVVTSRLILVFGICVLAMLPTLAAASQLCDDLRMILASTEVGYKPLRGAFDYFFNEYTATITPPPFSECRTNTGSGSSRYSCSKALPDDVVIADKELASAAQEIEACFGSEIVRRSGTPARRLSYRNVGTGESISLSVSRHVPKDSDRVPRYTLWMRVSNVDLSAKE
jgi:hypothetical protein